MNRDDLHEIDTTVRQVRGQLRFRSRGLTPFAADSDPVVMHYRSGGGGTMFEIIAGVMCEDWHWSTFGFVSEIGAVEISAHISYVGMMRYETADAARRQARKVAGMFQQLIDDDPDALRDKLRE